MERIFGLWLSFLVLTIYGTAQVRGQCQQEWSSLGAGTSGGNTVKALQIYDGDLIVAGQFTSAGEQPSNNIARWDGSTWAPLGNGLPSPLGPWALTVYNEELIAGGLTGYGQPNTFISRWNGSNWSPIASWHDDYVNALAVYNGELIAGGPTSFVEGTAIARWNGSTWAPLGTGINGSASVWSLVIYNDELIVGGQFSVAGGQPGNYIARWNGSAWSPLGTGMSGGSNGISTVRALAVYDDGLIAGGQFTIAGGQTANGIARWNGSDWSALGAGISGGTGSPSITPTAVYSLAVYDNELIVGGNFTRLCLKTLNFADNSP
jgi:hypothetical protein